MTALSHMRRLVASGFRAVATRLDGIEERATLRQRQVTEDLEAIKRMCRQLLERPDYGARIEELERHVLPFERRPTVQLRRPGRGEPG